MEEKRLPYLEEIPPEDWEKTRFLCQKAGGEDGAAH